MDISTDTVRAIRMGCPQGSPVSGVPASHYSTPLLEIFARESVQNHDARARNADGTIYNKETPITAGLFPDDGSLSNSPTTNAKRMQKGFEGVMI